MNEVDKIKKLMESRGLTSYQISKNTDVSEATLSRILSGKTKKPNASTLTSIVRYLESSTDLKINEPHAGYSLEKKNGVKFQELDNGRYLMYVPFIAEPAQAGYLSSFSDEDYIEELPYKAIIVENLHQGHYRAFEVAGDSMDDQTNKSIEHGDTVIARQIDRQYWKSRFHIHRFKEFVIVHEEGILIKEITHHDFEKGIINCHSYNDAPEYDDFELSLKDVYEIYNVVEVSKQRR